MKIPDYEWWIAHAHEDSAYLTLLKSHEYFVHLVTQRATTLQRPDVQGVVNQATYRALFEQHRFGSMAAILEGITPVAPAPPDTTTRHRPLRGRLRPDHKAIRDDTGPLPLVGVSAFWVPWAFRYDRARLGDFLSWAQEAGFGYVRWFGAHDWAGGTTPSEVSNYYEVMAHCLEYLAQHGLRSEVTLFSRRAMIPDPVEAAREWGRVVEAHRAQVCLVEIANEWNHADNGWTTREVRDAGEAFRAISGAPLAYSAAAGATWHHDKEPATSDLYRNGLADACTVHLPRRQDTNERAWRWVRQAWHTRHIADAPTIRVDNEHQRWDKSTPVGTRQVAEAVASLLNALVSGCAMTCHHDSYGVHNNHGSYHGCGASAELQQTLRRIVPVLPGDLPNWQPTRVGVGGGPHPFPGLLDQHWTFAPGPQPGVSRAFAAVRDDRFVMVLSGVRGSVTVDQYAKPYVVQCCTTGEQVYAGHGPVTLHDGPVPDTTAYVVTCL